MTNWKSLLKNVISPKTTRISLLLNVTVKRGKGISIQGTERIIPFSRKKACILSKLYIRWPVHVIKCLLKWESLNNSISDFHECESVSEWSNLWRKSHVSALKSKHLTPFTQPQKTSVNQIQIRQYEGKMRKWCCSSALCKSNILTRDSNSNPVKYYRLPREELIQNEYKNISQTDSFNWQSGHICAALCSISQKEISSYLSDTVWEI